MSIRTLPITAGSFEKVFTAVATKRTFRRKSQSGEIVKLVSPSWNTATWCAIACEALETETLGDTLRRAIQALSVKYREVLFLQDLKNLSTAETAWVLDITVGAVRSRLLRARIKVRNALASRLQPKPSGVDARRGITLPFVQQMASGLIVLAQLACSREWFVSPIGQTSNDDGVFA